MLSGQLLILWMERKSKGDSSAVPRTISIKNVRSRRTEVGDGLCPSEIMRNDLKKNEEVFSRVEKEGRVA